MPTPNTPTPEDIDQAAAVLQYALEARDAAHVLAAGQFVRDLERIRVKLHATAADLAMADYW